MSTAKDDGQDGFPAREGGARDECLRRKSNKMGVTDLEASREKLEAVAEQQDAPKEEVTEDIIGALEDRYGDPHSVVEHRRQPKKQTQSDGVS
jgi:translation initiation factor 2 alpha subunit (eIF-2alpha)